MTDRNISQRGASLISLMVVMSLSLISIVAASKFFMDSSLTAKTIISESETVAHWSMLLKQSFGGRCLELEDLKVTFKKSVTTPTIIQSRIEKTAKERASTKASKATLGVLRNAVGKSYDVLAFAIVQKSNVIGADPGRVMADLNVSVQDKARKLKSTITVPMLLDLDASMRAVACNVQPTAEEICQKMKGVFDDRSGNPTVCSIVK